MIHQGKATFIPQTNEIHKPEPEPKQKTTGKTIIGDVEIDSKTGGKKRIIGGLDVHKKDVDTVLEKLGLPTIPRSVLVNMLYKTKSAIDPDTLFELGKDISWGLVVDKSREHGQQLQRDRALAKKGRPKHFESMFYPKKEPLIGDDEDGDNWLKFSRI